MLCADFHAVSGVVVGSNYVNCADRLCTARRIRPREGRWSLLSVSVFEDVRYSQSYRLEVRFLLGVVGLHLGTASGHFEGPTSVTVVLLSVDYRVYFNSLFNTCKQIGFGATKSPVAQHLAALWTPGHGPARVLLHMAGVELARYGAGQGRTVPFRAVDPETTRLR
jgi:hypothetical protein